MNYYAIEYAYGKLSENNGLRADKVRQFESKSARTTWVLKGSDSMRDTGFREAVSVRHPLVKRFLANYDAS